MVKNKEDKKDNNKKQRNKLVLSKKLSNITLKKYIKEKNISKKDKNQILEEQNKDIKKSKDKKPGFFKKIFISNKKNDPIDLNFIDKINSDKTKIKGCLYCHNENYELREFKPHNINDWRLLNKKQDLFYYGICEECLNDKERLNVGQKIRKEENNYLKDFKLI